MPKTILQGRFSHRLRGISYLLGISCQVLARRTFGKPLVTQWPAIFEMATLFWRAQFNHAFSLPDIAQARAYFDSVYSVPDQLPQVRVIPTTAGEPSGDWYIPHVYKRPATLLYFHGGGYAFYAKVSRLFIALLAEWLGIRIFAPNYRLTPEHPYPAQFEDGINAYTFLLGQPLHPTNIIIGGDSAGGHLALMTLIHLRQQNMPKPAMGFAISPWTDVGLRGNSQFGHDHYDMVQGYMTLKFAQWLKGNSDVSDKILSPIYQNLHDLPPLYLQAGGKEILVDMIRDFTHELVSQGGQGRLDVWPHMTHEFHAYGNLLPESQQALDFIGHAIDWVYDHTIAFPPLAETEINSLPVK